jgi:hypothetical protein
MDKHQYRFVKLIESSVQAPRKTKEGEILAWLYLHQIEDFVEIMGPDFLCEGGIDVTLLDGCICVELNDVLHYLDIEEDVFETEAD